MENILSQFEKLNEAEAKELHLHLIRKATAPILRSLYKEIGHLLSFDIVSQLPAELAEEVFSYLDESSLCAAAQCSKEWRVIANNEKIWYGQCQKKNYLKYKDLRPSPDWEKGQRPTSPQYKMHDIANIPTVLKPPMCQWKGVFMKGRVLERNWRKGIYLVAPLLRGHQEPISGLCVQGDSMVSSSRDGTVCVWSIESLQVVRSLDKHTDEINCLALSNGYIVTGCADGVVRVFSLASGQLLWLLNEGGGTVDELACNEAYIVSGCDDFSLHVWRFTAPGAPPSSAAKPAHIQVLQGHTASITCLILRHNLLTSGSWDSSLRVWNCEKGVCNHVISAHEEGVNCIVVNDSGQVVSGGGDGVVRLWNTLSGNNILEMRGHSQEITCVKCKDDIIVSSSADSSVRIWNYKGVCNFTLESHLGLVRCLCLSGDRLVSGGDRKRINVWDIKTGKLLHTVHRQQTLLHLMTVTDFMIITGAPDTGTISIIKYW